MLQLSDPKHEAQSPEQYLHIGMKMQRSLSLLKNKECSSESAEIL